MPSSSNFGMSGRRWLWLLLIVGATILVASRFTNARYFLSVLSQGRWPWLVAAILGHLVYFTFYALLYRFAFDAVEVKSRMRELVPVLFASIFINAIAPTGGAGAAAVFVDDAIQRGQSGARAAVGTVVVLLADLFMALPFIIASLVFLGLQHKLQGYTLGGSVAFFVFSLILVIALVLAAWKPRLLRRIFTWLEAIANYIGRWFRRDRLLSERWAENNAWQFTEGSRAILHHPRPVVFATLLVLGLHLLNLVSLYWICRGFNQHPSWGAVTAAFGMSFVYFVISVIPQAVGVVEGVMSLIFTTEGISGSAAITISLAYRGLNFWLPLIAGFFFLHRIRSFRSRVEKTRSDNSSTDDADPTEGSERKEDS